MDLGTIISLAIAGLSLSVSASVWWGQRQVQGRAHFTAEWEGRESIVYINHGPGAAMDVKVHLETQARTEDRTIPYIGAFQSMRIGGITRLVGERSAEELHMEWKDNRRNRQSVAIHLPDAPRPPQRSRVRSDLEKTVRAIAKDEAENEIAELGKRVGRNR